jgi:hypothetical protein
MQQHVMPQHSGQYMNPNMQPQGGNAQWSQQQQQQQQQQMMMNRPISPNRGFAEQAGKITKAKRQNSAGRASGGVPGRKKKTQLSQDGSEVREVEGINK